MLINFSLNTSINFLLIIFSWNKHIHYYAIAIYLFYFSIIGGITAYIFLFILLEIFSTLKYLFYFFIVAEKLIDTLNTIEKKPYNDLYFFLILFSLLN